MTTGQKKVVVRKWSREVSQGYLPPEGFTGEGDVGLLKPDGKITSVPLAEIKWIRFVRDFRGEGEDEPERLLRKSFGHRPRTPGLWLRIRLNDDDSIEGMTRNGLNLLSCRGISFSPPDSRSNTQRMLIPREAIRELEIVAVVRLPALRKQRAASLQENLFDR